MNEVIYHPDSFNLSKNVFGVDFVVDACHRTKFRLRLLIGRLPP